MIPAYALYRRSTAAQDLSVEEQRQAVRAWAEANGYRIVREFADDASGLDTARRHKFLTLLQLCAQPSAREAEVVLCYDVSRFSRLDPDEAAFHEHSLRRAGVRVVYTHEPGANEGGLAGHLVKSLKRVLAHEYSQKLAQVVQRGQRAHAALGHWVGGRPPYGYRRAVLRPDGTTVPLEPGRWKARGERVVLVVEPAEAAVVREHIYEPYVFRGLGLLAITGRLNALGIPAPAALRRHGVAAWSKLTVWHILRSPTYRGRLVWGRARYRELGRKRGKARRPESEHVIADGAVPAIIPAQLWETAQARHGVRKFGSGRPWHRGYLLSGLIECGHCGKRFQAQRQYRGTIPAYYLCGGYVASGVAVCASPRIPTPYLDDAVLDGIQKRLERVVDPAELRPRLRTLLGPEHAPVETAPDLERRLAETAARIGRLVEALAGGPEDLPSVRAALVGLERDRAALEERLATAKRHGGDVTEQRLDGTIERLIGALANAREALQAGTAEERKAVVRLFLKGIRIEAAKRRAVLQWYRIPQDAFVKLVAVGGIEPPTRGL